MLGPQVRAAAACRSRFGARLFVQTARISVVAARFFMDEKLRHMDVDHRRVDEKRRPMGKKLAYMARGCWRMDVFAPRMYRTEWCHQSGCQVVYRDCWNKTDQLAETLESALTILRGNHVEALSARRNEFESRFGIGKYDARRSRCVQISYGSGIRKLRFTIFNRCRQGRKRSRFNTDRRWEDWRGQILGLLYSVS